MAFQSRFIRCVMAASILASGFFIGPLHAERAALTLLSRSYMFSGGGEEISLTPGESRIALNPSMADSFTLTATLDGTRFPCDTLLRAEGLAAIFTTPAERGDAGFFLKAAVAFRDTVTADAPAVREMVLEAPVDRDFFSSPHRIVVNYTGPLLSLYIDGKLIDSDFPIGVPRAGDCVAEVGRGLSHVTVASPAKTAERTGTGSTDIPQYWTPPFHNAWVGDVVACHYNGRYHLFYLFDRRGHQSKFGKGGHYFEHLSTSDLIDWKEHEAAVPIEEQWETLGTGTPFELDGKLCLAYGLHTTRLYPEGKTTLPAMKEAYTRTGRTWPLSYDTVASAVAAGSTYAESLDGGETFRKTGRLFHFCENPSIYRDTDGDYRMLANYGAHGTWRHDHLSGGWVCTDSVFPPGGDCTFPFSMGGHDYVIGGFTGLWAKPSGTSEAEFTDIVKTGKDCYNGLSVPAVTALPDGRFLMSGWLKMRNWGGALVTHEIFPDGSDGRLGTRWVEELVPDLPEVAIGPSGIVETPVAFMTSFRLTPEKPGSGSATLEFGDHSFWTLSLDENRAWFSDEYGESRPVLSEGGDPAGARDYAVPFSPSGRKEIPVRLIVYSRPKFNGSIIDVEIDGRRTMLSFRPGLTVENVCFTGDGVALSR